MRILVTGGTGFIGSALVDQLRLHNSVFVLTRNDAFDANRKENTEYARGDLLSAEDTNTVVAHYRPEIIVHLAAYTPVRFSFDKPHAYTNANYVATVNLVEAAVRARCVRQFVYASTAEIYGPYAEDHSVTEESNPAPTSPYSISKLAGEHYVVYGPHRDRNMHYTVLRSTNTFGRKFNLPDEARGYFMEKLIIGLLKNEPVDFDGFPESKRRWMYVTDHVNGYLKVIGNTKAFDQVFNIAPEEPAASLEEVVEITKKITGSTSEVTWANDPRPIDPNYIDIVPTKAFKAFGYSAKVPLRTGISTAVEYWSGVLSPRDVKV